MHVLLLTVQNVKFQIFVILVWSGQENQQTLETDVKVVFRTIVHLVRILGTVLVVKMVINLIGIELFVSNV